MNPADHAPLLLLHPQEDCFPVDPVEFVQRSRFRHHRSAGKDDGWSKSRNGWVRNNDRTPDYYDIPLAVINSFGLHSNGKNRRPRDKNSGHDKDVFLQPDGVTTGAGDFNGRVPAFYWHDQQKSQLQFWFFYGYNRGFNEGPFRINHQGDWEHVRVHLSGDTATGMELSAHGRRTYHPANQLRQVGGRFAAYVAKGTHAMYPSAGDFRHDGVAVDHTADGGPAWETWRALQSLEAQPWRDYAGAWGEVGELADTTGPLGPWHKRG
jgi:hypothetical protein